jgi:hypothetical protein
MLDWVRVKEVLSDLYGVLSDLQVKETSVRRRKPRAAERARMRWLIGRLERHPFVARLVPEDFDPAAAPDAEPLYSPGCQAPVPAAQTDSAK